ncbi:MAG: insulinase family protein [Candidatus Eremiobacteraeota bacterium]|nr:pitrilysin family protein [Candidatus Eremiobacteraeota bacterium]NNM92714.1 insulinase family protein [Candidatus Eremiobacteraeota bacterium]
MRRKTVLENGVRVITEAISSVRSASIGLWVDVGSSAEAPHLRGVSHMVEHMLFKGTRRRSAREIAEALDSVGGDLNAFTDKETTCYYAKVIDRHVPLAIDVLCDMLTDSLFDPEELRKERNVVLEEIKMYEDAPDELVHEVFSQQLWEGSDLGAPTIGYPETVGALESNDLHAHLAAHYAPNAVVLCAAGNVDHDEIVALAKRALGAQTGNAALPVATAPTVRTALARRSKEIEQVHLVLGGPCVSARDDRRFALSVAQTILGGGMSSRLFQEVREKRGLVYTITAFGSTYREAGSLAVYAGTSLKNAQPCIDTILGEVDRLASVPVEEVELRQAKEHLKGSMMLGLESTSSRMMRLGRQELIHGREIPQEEIEARIDAVSTEGVLEIASLAFTPKRRALALVGPTTAAEIGWGTRGA